MRRRRYEILLPLKFNDGRPVGDELLDQTREDLLARFEGMTYNPQGLIGTWIHGGVRYHDECVQVTIEVEDTPENHEFFVSFKANLLSRFEQLDIYIAYYAVDIL
jgi:hypothetical protein